MTAPRDDDPVRDPHLLAALRHAPDRDAQPPTEVTERILAAARAAVRPPRPSPATPPSAWQRVSDWLARPAVGAAFGTLVAAVLVGVLWSTREPPTTVGEPEAGPAAMPAPAPAADAGAARRADVAAPPPVTSAAPSARPTAPPAPSTERTPVKREPPVRPPAAPGTTPPAPAAVQALPPPASDSPAKNEVPRVEQPRPERSSDRMLLERAAKSTDAAVDTARERAAGPSAAPAVSALAGAAAVADPLDALQPSAAAGWTWRVAARGTEWAHAGPQEALWNALRAAMRGRWQRASPTAPLTPWMALEQRAAGVTVSFSWADDATLWLTDAQGGTWRAALAPAQRDEWQQTVSRW